MLLTEILLKIFSAVSTFFLHINGYIMLLNSMKSLVFRFNWIDSHTYEFENHFNRLLLTVQMRSNVASCVKVKSSMEQTPLRDENSGRPEGWPLGALRPGPASPLTPLTHRHPKTVGRRGPEPSWKGSSSFVVKRLQKNTPQRTYMVSPSGRGVWPPGRPPPGGPRAQPTLPRRGEEKRPPPPCLRSPVGGGSNAHGKHHLAH